MNNIADDITELRFDLARLIYSNHCLEKAVAQQSGLLTRVADRIMEPVRVEEQTVGSIDSPVVASEEVPIQVNDEVGVVDDVVSSVAAVSALAPRPITLFSDSMCRWSNDFSLDEIFFNFYKDRCIEGYELEKNSRDFKSKLPSERKKITGKYKRLKKAVKVILVFFFFRQLSETHATRPQESLCVAS